MDMPFSKRPVMFGSYIASIFKDDHLSSRNFLKAGLYSHPYDPQILNNLAYSLALENKLDDAYSYLNKIRSHHVMNDTTKICLTATKGLLYYRKGYVDFGRTFYLDAIKQTKSIRNKYLNNLAILNFAREEILRKSKYAEKLMNSVYKIPDDLIDRDINKLKKEVINLYDKNKNNLK
jgi:hypothetical protein